jgi:hypothetical protein
MIMTGGFLYPVLGRLTVLPTFIHTFLPYNAPDSDQTDRTGGKSEARSWQSVSGDRQSNTLKTDEGLLGLPLYGERKESPWLRQ